MGKKPEVKKQKEISSRPTFEERQAIIESHEKALLDHEKEAQAEEPPRTTKHNHMLKRR
jgi:hypothetical protein